MKLDRTVKIVTANEKKQWDSVVHHPLQSWSWGEFRAGMGIDVLRLGVYEKNILVEGWQLSLHPIGPFGYTVGYFPKGPKPTEEMLRALLIEARKKHAIYIQMEPDTLAVETIDTKGIHSFVPSHRPLFTKYTFVLDIARKEEEILASLHSKTRYNIKVAQKHGVISKEDNSEKAFAAYLALSEETKNRQGFYAHNRRYHKTMWNILHKAGIAHLFTATYQDTVVAAWIMFVWRDTLYYPYGASSRAHRDVMAPNLLLWEIIRWAKKQGLFYIDLWGAMGPNPDIQDPWYGFHRFKEGYKPELIEYIGSYDLIVHPVLYKLFIIADTIRWMFLKLKLQS